MAAAHRRRRRLLVVVPELEYALQDMLSDLDTASQQVFEQEYETHVISRRVLRFLGLPAGSVVIRDQEDIEALRGVVEALSALLWQIQEHREAGE